MKATNFVVWWWKYVRCSFTSFVRSFVHRSFVHSLRSFVHCVRSLTSFTWLTSSMTSLITSLTICSFIRFVHVVRSFVRSLR